MPNTSYIPRLTTQKAEGVQETTAFAPPLTVELEMLVQLTQVQGRYWYLGKAWKHQKLHGRVSINSS